jgi:Niemann-Pick C1 protein
MQIFPYSIFYVYYEQYLTMWAETLFTLGVSIAAIFLVTFLLLGLDVVCSCIILLIICMILVDLMGTMFWWNIQLNGVSLVNLVVAIGISVEFCAHMTRSYSVNPENNKILRAKTTLVTMGSSVRVNIANCIP